MGCRDLGLLHCRTTYLDAALRVHRETLDRLSSQTADAACFTSILLLVDAFATLQNRPLDPYEPPIQWLRIAYGARCVFDASGPFIKAEPRPLIRTITDSATGFSHPSALFSEANMQKFPYLLQPLPPHGAMSPDDECDAEVMSVYKQTVSYIGSVKAAIDSGESPKVLCRRLMSFASLIPSRFLELVEEKAPRALIILAHLFAVFVHVKDTWWIGNTPYREVYAIRDYIPSALHPLLEWPLCFLTDTRKLTATD